MFERLSVQFLIAQLRVLCAFVRGLFGAVAPTEEREISRGGAGSAEGDLSHRAHGVHRGGFPLRVLCAFVRRFFG